MNINFIVDKEKEKVIVSNEEGKLEVRDYQDNIKDVFILENIVEGLESDFNLLNQKQEENDANIEDLNNQVVEDASWKKRADKRWFWTGVGITIFSTSLGYIAEVPDLNPNIIEQLQNIEVLKSTSFGLGFGFLADGVLYKTRNSLRKQYHEEEDLVDLEKEQKQLKLELFYTRHVLYENKNRLLYIAQQKEKLNLQNMSTEIQKVPYLEPLENIRAYLRQLVQENKDSQNGQTLERIKKD